MVKHFQNKAVKNRASRLRNPVIFLQNPGNTGLLQPHSSLTLPYKE